MVRRRLLLLLALGCGLAATTTAAFVRPIPRASPRQQQRRCRPSRPCRLVMSEAVVAVGSGRFHPAWPLSASSAAAAPSEQQERRQEDRATPPPAGAAPAATSSRFRRALAPSSSPSRSPQPRTRPGPAVPSQLRIVLTGFGPFQGVADNPSEALARRLGAAVEEDLEPDEETVVPFALSSSVMETSAGGAAEGLASIHEGLAAEGLGQEENLLFVHLGVRHDIEGFHLESVGYNEADFQVPDEREFQPRGEAVSTTDGDTSSLLFSTLPLQSIMRSLHAQQGYNRSEVAISTDAGRFVCNYLYYRSLEFCRARGPHTAALFVHLPPFSRVPSDAQFAFLHHLLSTAAAHFPHVGQTPGLLS